MGQSNWERLQMAELNTRRITKEMLLDLMQNMHNRWVKEGKVEELDAKQSMLYEELAEVMAIEGFVLSGTFVNLKNYLEAKEKRD